MKEIILRVYQKGRVHIPKEVRERLGIKERVKGRIEGRVLVVEPVQNLLDRLASQVRFNFGSIEEALPDLRKAAEDQMLKEAQ